MVHLLSSSLRCRGNLEKLTPRSYELYGSQSTGESSNTHRSCDLFAQKQCSRAKLLLSCHKVLCGCLYAWETGDQQRRTASRSSPLVGYRSVSSGSTFSG